MPGDPIRLGSAALSAATYTDGEEFTKGTNGRVDSLRRPFKCPASLLSSLLPAIGTVHPTYGNLRVSTYNFKNIVGTTSEVDLIYRGLIDGIIPSAHSVDDTGIATTTVSADVSSLGITNSDGVAAKTATRDIEFDSPQTAYFYIAGFRPTLATYGTIANGRTARIRRSIITLDNGIRYAEANAPAALVSALFVAPSNQVIGPHADPVWGTSYFECQDLVQNGYWN